MLEIDKDPNRDLVKDEVKRNPNRQVGLKSVNPDSFAFDAHYLDYREADLSQESERGFALMYKTTTASTCGNRV